jgi:hypothetical protein
MRILSSNKDLSDATLATRLLVGRLRREAKGDPAQIREKSRELRAQIEKNAFMTADVRYF